MSDSEDEYVLAAGLAAAAAVVATKKKRKRVRTVQTKPFLLRRLEYGWFHTLMKELRAEDPDLYKNFLRVDANAFDELTALVHNDIVRQNTVMRPSITPAERLAITLRFLATGQTYQDLEFGFRTSHSSNRDIVPETCTAIYNALKDTHLKVPNSEEEWLAVAKGYEERWNFPHCIGSLDGKHVTIRKPDDAGSYYYNYKGSHSIVLMALVDADCKFLYFDVGCQGRISDGGVWAHCSLSRAIKEKRLNIPEPTQIRSVRTKQVDDEEVEEEKITKPLPYTILADNAFPLQTSIMKPYALPGHSLEKHIYNYRTSRGRRCVENTFGILANRFRILLTQINMDPDDVQQVVLACCALHNWLASHKTASRVYAPPGTTDYEDPSTHEIVEGAWRQEPGRLPPLQKVPRRGTLGAEAVRNEFCRYFNEEGAVEWQWERVRVV